MAVDRSLLEEFCGHALDRLAHLINQHQARGRSKTDWIEMGIDGNLDHLVDHFEKYESREESTEYDLLNLTCRGMFALELDLRAKLGIVDIK